MHQPFRLPPFCKHFLYSTQGAYYIAGKCKGSKDAKHAASWSILTLKRGSNDCAEGELDVCETSQLSQAQCTATLKQLHAGNALARPAGLQLVCKVSCFSRCTYLPLAPSEKREDLHLH